MADEEDSPLVSLAGAIQTFANAIADEPPVLVGGALVLWEQVRYDEDGDVCRSIRYAVPTDSSTLTGSLGLLEAAGEYLRRDILGDD